LPTHVNIPIAFALDALYLNWAEQNDGII